MRVGAAGGTGGTGATDDAGDAGDAVVAPRDVDELVVDDEACTAGGCEYGLLVGAGAGLSLSPSLGRRISFTGTSLLKSPSSKLLTHTTSN